MLSFIWRLWLFYWNVPVGRSRSCRCMVKTKNHVGLGAFTVWLNMCSQPYINELLLWGLLGLALLWHADCRRSIQHRRRHRKTGGGSLQVQDKLVTWSVFSFLRYVWSPSFLSYYSYFLCLVAVTWPFLAYCALCCVMCAGLAIISQTWTHSALYFLSFF